MPKVSAEIWGPKLDNQGHTHFAVCITDNATGRQVRGTINNVSNLREALCELYGYAANAARYSEHHLPVSTYNSMVKDLPLLGATSRAISHSIMLALEAADLEDSHEERRMILSMETERVLWDKSQQYKELGEDEYDIR